MIFEQQDGTIDESEGINTFQKMMLIFALHFFLKWFQLSGNEKTFPHKANMPSK